MTGFSRKYTDDLEFYAEDPGNIGMSGTPNLKIYLKMARLDTFPAANLNWTSESKSTGAILVYDGNPVSFINGVNEFKNFIFNVYYVSSKSLTSASRKDTTHANLPPFHNHFLYNHQMER